MKEYRYKLEPYKGMGTRYHCPNCQKKEKTFVRYVNTETGEYLASNVGRCNREVNCGYHYPPEEYFKENSISLKQNNTSIHKILKIRVQEKQSNTVSLIPVEVFKESLKGYKANHFVKFLIEKFGVKIASELVSRYFIATSKYWKDSTIFWQIDMRGKIRTGKIMLYNSTTGKRIKKPFSHISWVHISLKQDNFELKQCLFGEHLLIDRTKPVAIVESEKTAIIASVYFPQFIWVAVGSLTYLNVQKCNVLQGRTVILFPDLNGFAKWSKKAKEFSSQISGAKFMVSDLLERKATEMEKNQGSDLADYLLKFDHLEFIKPDIDRHSDQFIQKLLTKM